MRAHVRVRHNLRSGALLLRDAWLQILQTAVAACLAWFAPIAAVICLGLAVGERGRRAVDQIHSSTLDLLGGTGMDRGEALAALEVATGRAT